jgi:hypothetical protein
MEGIDACLPAIASAFDAEEERDAQQEDHGERGEEQQRRRGEWLHGVYYKRARGSWSPTVTTALERFNGKPALKVVGSGSLPQSPLFFRARRR